MIGIDEHSFSTAQRQLTPHLCLNYLQHNPKIRHHGAGGKCFAILHQQGISLIIHLRVSLFEKISQPPGGSCRLTLQYASPEQVGGDLVTTASDIYQLGLLAYELLTRERAYELANLPAEEARRLICEVEPKPPSRLLRGAGLSDGRRWHRRLSARDFDAILLKALAKKPENRYSSVDRLREDLERALGGRAVLARSQTALYRTARFLGRHRLTVSFTVIAAAIFLALAASFTWRLATERDATRAQALRARQAHRESQEVVRFLTDIFEVADPMSSENSEITARELLDSGARRLETELAEQPIVRARVLTVVGDIYQRLGMYDRAEPLLVQGLELRRGKVADESLELADSWHKLGLLKKHRGELAEADKLLGAALAIYSASPEGSLLPQALIDLGNLRLDQGRHDEAEELIRQGLGLYQGLNDRSGAAAAKVNLSNVLAEAGRKQEASELLAEVVLTLEDMHGPDHVSIGRALVNLAALHAERGAPGDAVPLYERGLLIFESSYGPDHLNVAKTEANLGNALSALERYDEARSYMLSAIDKYERAVGEHPDTARVVNNLGALEWRVGRAAEAEDLYRRTLSIYRKLLPDEHPQIALTLFNLGEALLGRGETEAAAASLRASRDMFLGTLGSQHPLASWPMLHLARLHAGQSQPELAEPLVARTRGLRRAAEGVDPADLEEAVQAYVDFLRQRGRDNEALSLLDSHQEKEVSPG